MNNLILANSPTLNISTSGLTLPGTVWAKAIYHNGQCTAESNISLAPPITSATVQDLVICPTTKSTDHFMVCVTGGTPPLNYQWSPSAGLTNPNVPSPGINLFVPGVYPFSVTVTDAVGCMATAQANVTVLDDEDLEIIGTRSICEDIPVVKTYEITNFDPNFTYTWSLNTSSPGASATILSQNGGAVTIEITSLPALIDGAIILEVTATSPEPVCDKTGLFRIYECCSKLDAINLIDEELTQAKITSAGPLLLQGTIEVKSNLTINNNTIWMGPEAKIVVAAGVLFAIDLNSATTSKTVQQGCEIMWDGIYVQDITAEVEIEDTHVSDALQAVVSKNGGTFTIKNCQFNDHFIGVYVKNYYAMAPATPVTNHAGVITGTSFQSTTSSGLLQYYPKEFYKPYCGISSKKVNGLTIGDDTQNKNSFENLEYGIVSQNSWIKVANNEFANISPDPLYSLTGAISSEFSYGNLSAYQISPLTEVKGSSPLIRNFFQNCYTGIHTRNVKLEVTDNTFLNMDASHYGVFGVDIRDGSDVSNNSITGAYTGIKLTNAVVSRIDVLIDNNEIKEVNRGIHTINLGGERGGKFLRIVDNEVRPDGYLNNRRLIGIYVENCPHSYIWCNSLYLPPPIVPTNQIEAVRGIWISETSASVIYNNSIFLFGYGIHTTGTQINNRFYCNYLNNCYHGFFFGPDTRLTNQGWMGIPNKADWIPHNAFYNDIAGYPRLQMNSGNILQPIRWYYSDNQGMQYETMLSAQGSICGISPNLGAPKPITEIVNNATHSCEYSSTNNCLPDPVALANDTTMTPEERELLYGAILETDELMQQVNPEYYSYSAEYLFNELFQDSSLMFLGGTQDGEYQEFFDSLRNEPIGQFVKVEQLIEESRYTEAISLNEAIVPVTSLEAYRQQVYRIYLLSFCTNQPVLSPEDSATLLGVALLTPYNGGFGVYTARVMLGIDPEDYNVAYRKSDKGYAMTGVVKVYPNPANHLVALDISEEIEQVDGYVEFFGIYGQMLNRCAVGKHSSDIDVSGFPPGVLYYRVINRGKLIGSGKLLIVK